MALIMLCNLRCAVVEKTGGCLRAFWCPGPESNFIVGLWVYSRKDAQKGTQGVGRADLTAPNRRA